MKRLDRVVKEKMDDFGDKLMDKVIDSILPKNSVVVDLIRNIDDFVITIETDKESEEINVKFKKKKEL